MVRVSFNLKLIAVSKLTKKRPCQQLGPILEREVKAMNGKVRMAKLNTDLHPQLAQQLQVKSLPTVMLINQGKLVDQFIGFTGEASVKQFVAKASSLSVNSPTSNDGAQDLVQLEGMLGGIMEILKLQSSPPASGEQSRRASEKELADILTALRQLAGFKLEPLPSNTHKTAKRRADEDTAEMIRAISHAGLIRLALLKDDFEAVKEITSAMKSQFSKNALEHQEVKSAMALAALSSSNPANDEERNKLYQSIKSNPNDLAARLKLSKALFADGAHGEAVSEALELLKRDRNYENGAARTLLLDIFNALGNNNDIVKEARKKMTSILLH